MLTGTSHIKCRPLWRKKRRKKDIDITESKSFGTVLYCIITT